MKKSAQTRPETTNRNIFSLTPDDLKAITGGRGIIQTATGGGGTAKP